MFAIIQIGSHQYKVREAEKIFVNRLDAGEGTDITLDKVLIVDGNENVSVGLPYVKNASVAAKVLKHLKSDKVLVFKKKKRKGYRKLNGHRQQITQLEITKINLS